MFNPWKIVKVWNVDFHGEESVCGNAVFSFSPLVEYRTNSGCYMLFQTEKNYISLGADGVHVYNDNPYTWPQYDLYDFDNMDDENPIEGLETTLFVGERLIDVIEEEKRYRLSFDHFEMFLVPEYEEDFGFDENAIDYPIHAFDRYIKRKCSCGGNPELMMDENSDFYVRCDRCHKSTLISFEVKAVLDDWNDGAIESIVETSEDIFKKLVSEPIKYIALDEDSICFDDNLWDCNDCVIAIGEKLFILKCQRIADSEYGFSFAERYHYNKKMWPYLIKSSQEEIIRFIRMEDDGLMRLQIGNRPLLLTASDRSIMIGISHIGLNDEWLDFDNNSLVDN